uniref:Nuclear envelope integral membrane protein 1 n=2 Tax=Photinus pyralis TaxID=7054 RepID=A0A1Y1KIZ8_PHOPY
MLRISTLSNMAGIKCCTTLFLICLFTRCISSTQYRRTVKYLAQGPYNIAQKDSSELVMFCYDGKPKSIIYLWQSIYVDLDLKPESYNYYEGPTPDIVYGEYLEQRSSWSLNLFAWKQKSIKLDPFNQTCLGIDTMQKYKISLQVLRFDYWKFLWLVLGVLLFFNAGTLSKNTLFYYICGVSFGICASFLILIYFFSRMFPNRPLVYGVAVFGWTIGVYMLELLRENIKSVVLIYYEYLIWYTIIMGLISFVVCYRWGPVTNERTRNLIRWSLQALGLVLVLNSTHFQEAAVGQIAIIIFIYNFPTKWVTRSKTYWRRTFPPKTKRLTNAEYYQEGVKETSDALENLRKYCSSPECNQWQTALKLKDVKRFASFIQGNSHLTDAEILEYESSVATTDVTDDEEDLFTDEEM